MSTIAPRTALITGASSGIGASLARQLGELGWSVGLGARRTERLDQVAAEVEAAGGRAFAHALDVVDTDSIDAFLSAAADALGPPDAVVSNAGSSRPSLHHEYSDDQIRRELEVNLLGPMFLARRVCPGLAERGGDLLLVSSLNAVLPRTFQSGYTAAKAGLEAFARVLQMEWEGTPLRIGVVRPGPTGSEFGADYGGDISRRILESWKHWGVLRQLHWMSADDAARTIVAALCMPPGVKLDVVEVTPMNTKRGPL
jgi:NADP-dependent 3-hydroxy acid dehydrogenase YdfG